MKVTLLTHTPQPEVVVGTAARLCYSPEPIDIILKKNTNESVWTFIERLMELGHESPLEHVTFTFGIEGISRACSHQLVRHRIASYSQKSQRYVSEKQFEYVIPESISKDPELEKDYIELMNHIQSKYDDFREKMVDRFTSNGMAKTFAEKKANEDARYVLPNACQTSLVVTMNIRSLFNFFKLRCCNRAQWEIREVATEMYKICRMVAPHIFRYAGPPCVIEGHCPEGTLTCGKAKEKLEEFKSYSVGEL